MPTELELNSWIEEVDAAAARIAPRFSRKDLRAHSARYLRGLISRVERKNGWQLAEELGEQTPTNLQHFIARSSWDTDQVRDDLQQYVMEHLVGSKDGILIIDETGFLTAFSFWGDQVPRSETTAMFFLLSRNSGANRKLSDRCVSG